MKIGITFPMHWSDEFRPRGYEFSKRVIDSMNQHIQGDFKIYVVDNGSQYKSDTNTFKNVEYTFIEDQIIGGITHAYNVGIHNAYKDNCDIIIVASDDLIINDSINKFIKYINNDTDHIDSIYGPLSDGLLGGHQLSNNIRGDNVDVIDVINGFLFAFTKQHYEKYRSTESTYFDENKINKWGGQESQFEFNRNKGAKCKVLNFCWIHHEKQRGWKKLYTMYKN